MDVHVYLYIYLHVCMQMQASLQMSEGTPRRMIGIVGAGFRLEFPHGTIATVRHRKWQEAFSLSCHRSLMSGP